MPTPDSQARFEELITARNRAWEAAQKLLAGLPEDPDANQLKAEMTAIMRAESSGCEGHLELSHKATAHAAHLLTYASTHTGPEADAAKAEGHIWMTWANAFYSDYSHCLANEAIAKIDKWLTDKL